MDMSHYNMQSPQTEPTPQSAAATGHILHQIHGGHLTSGLLQNGLHNHHQHQHYLPHMIPPMLANQSESSPSPAAYPHHAASLPAYEENHRWKKMSLLPAIKIEPSEHPPTNSNQTLTAVTGNQQQQQDFLPELDLESATEPTVPSGMAPASSPSQTFVACRVCGDKASGYHYGVTSCEGCKGFFRRSMQKQIEYRCLREGKCQVMRLNRNRCQYCRFKKCVAVGMSRDSVRYGRVPKRSLSNDDQSVSSSHFNGLSPDLANHTFHGPVTHFSNHQPDEDNGVDAEKRLMLIDVILAVSHAHVAYCDETEEKLAAIEKKQRSLLNQPGSEFGSGEIGLANGIDAFKCQMFQGISQLVTPSINKVVEFAKRIPDFQNLTQDDQLTLIKTGFFEVCLVRSCRLYNDVEGTVLFYDGTYIHRRELDVVYGVDLVDAMFDFASQLTHLGLNDTEIGLFACIALITADRQGIVNYVGVQSLNERVMEAFALQLHRNHPVYPNLASAATTRLLPVLRFIGATHDRLLNYYRQRWRFVDLPPLFAEIYDFTRLEDQVDGSVSATSGCSDFLATTVANSDAVSDPRELASYDNCYKEQGAYSDGGKFKNFHISSNSESGALKKEENSKSSDYGISSSGASTVASCSPTASCVKVEKDELSTGVAK